MATTILERFTKPQTVGEFQIERGVPVPPRKRGRGGGRDPIYPFAQMRVGDSFEVYLTSQRFTRARPTISTLQSNLGNIARGYAKRHNPSARFTVRKVSDTAVRIWRVE